MMIDFYILAFFLTNAKITGREVKVMLLLTLRVFILQPRKTIFFEPVSESGLVLSKARLHDFFNLFISMGSHLLLLSACTIKICLPTCSHHFLIGSTFYKERLQKHTSITFFEFSAFFLSHFQMNSSSNHNCRRGIPLIEMSSYFSLRLEPSWSKWEKKESRLLAYPSNT